MTRQQRQQKDFLIFFATVQESNLQVQSSSKLTESQIGQQAIGWFLGPWWWSACSHSTTLLKHSVFSVILCLKRTKINKKEAGVGPLFIKKEIELFNLRFFHIVRHAYAIEIQFESDNFCIIKYFVFYFFTGVWKHFLNFHNTEVTGKVS